jgi:hypothetical protein
MPQPSSENAENVANRVRALFEQLKVDDPDGKVEEAVVRLIEELLREPSKE